MSVKGLVVVVASLWFCVACSSPQTVDMAPRVLDKPRLSEVSVTAPGFYLEAGDTLNWRRDVIVVEGEVMPGAIEHVEARQVRNVFEQGFMALGFPVVPGKGGRYEVVAAIVLGDSPAGDAVLEVAQLYPSLGASPDQLQQGMLLVGLARPGSRQFLWRSAIQGALHPEFSAAQQQERIKVVIADLLQDIPRR
ncbi:MAG: hypothetical protein AseanaTS_23190 [Candidatus Pelagadaptatus aseana]|uniref:hypothetical protein n=1 Tax=Candidatus Pelagadaptatus aseana TaxID=3120508 RepID=UPI0039B15940